MPIVFPPPREEIEDRLEAGDRALGRIMQVSPHTLCPGETLIHTGEPHDKIYRLTSGWMARSRLLPDGRQQIIMTFLPGDLLGLKVMLLDRQPDAVTCITNARVEAVRYEMALELAGNDRNVSLRFMWQLAEDERRLHNWVIALGCGSAVERIATLILDLHGRLVRAGLRRGNSFGLPMTQQQMADHLGLTAVHVSRTLTRLRGEGILTITRGLVQIQNIESLSVYAAPMQDIFERGSKSFGKGMPYASPAERPLALPPHGHEERT